MFLRFYASVIALVLVTGCLKQLDPMQNVAGDEIELSDTLAIPNGEKGKTESLTEKDLPAVDNIFVKLDSPNLMMHLEKNGFSFPEVVFSEKATTYNDELYEKNTMYKSLVDTVDGELKMLKQEDSSLQTEVGSSHRLFNIGWMKSHNAQYDLVSVVNRMDRRTFCFSCVLMDI